MRKRESGEELPEEMEEEEEDADKEPPVKPVFDEEEAFQRFDEREENAIVEIPDEVVDQIDDDWKLSENEEADLIAAYLASKEGAQ